MATDLARHLVDQTTPGICWGCTSGGPLSKCGLCHSCEQGSKECTQMEHTKCPPQDTCQSTCRETGARR